MKLITKRAHRLIPGLWIAIAYDDGRLAAEPVLGGRVRAWKHALRLGDELTRGTGIYHELEPTGTSGGRQT